MASFDLEDLIESLKYEINVPGEDAYGSTNTEEWVGRLANGFWKAFLDGFFGNYAESAGLIVPRSGDVTFPRDYQQVVILYTAIEILGQRLLAAKTSFRAKAGPVEYEEEQSATLLRSLLDQAYARLQYVRDQMTNSEVGGFISIDMYMSRLESFSDGTSTWVGN